MTYEHIDDGRLPEEQPGSPFPFNPRDNLQMAHSAILAERAERSDEQLGIPLQDIVSCDDGTPIARENIIAGNTAVAAALRASGADRKVTAISAGFKNRPVFLQELKRVLGEF